MIIQVILMIIFLYLLNYFVTRNTQILNNRKTDFMRLNDDRLERISQNQKLFDLIYCPEYKYYNPEAYQEIIDYLDAFLELFELIQIDPSRSSDLYQSMVDNKKYFKYCDKNLDLVNKVTYSPIERLFYHKSKFMFLNSSMYDSIK